jgi:hypothetical protein
MTCTDDAKIKISLVRTSVLTRWPCTVCGGSTGKVEVLAENQDLDIRVCEQCLKSRDFDRHLQEHARRHEQEARRIRRLIGRIEAPTYLNGSRKATNARPSSSAARSRKCALAVRR